MAYATDTERKALIESNTSFNPCPLIVRFKKGERESELCVDDVDHALSVSHQWIVNGASYVEIFRVNPVDGSITPTIGAYRKGE